jgi:hypothetical protein
MRRTQVEAFPPLVHSYLNDAGARNPAGEGLECSGVPEHLSSERLTSPESHRLSTFSVSALARLDVRLPGGGIGLAGWVDPLKGPNASNEQLPCAASAESEPYRTVAVTKGRSGAFTSRKSRRACSDPGEHQRRVEGRLSDRTGLRLPTWDEVRNREYDPWHRPDLVINTVGRSVDESRTELRKLIARVRRRPPCWRL